MQTRWQRSENCFTFGIQISEGGVIRIFLGWRTWTIALNGPAPIGFVVYSTDQPPR